MAEAIGRSASDIAGYMSADLRDRANEEERNRYRIESAQIAADARTESARIAAGSKPQPMNEDDLDKWTAGLTGQTAPEVRNLRHYVETGELPQSDAADYPPGFEDQLRAKAQAMYRVRESVATGKDYKDIASGRETQQGVGARDGIIGGTMKADDVGRAYAATKGEGSYKGTGETVYDQFDGEIRTTPVGASIIKKNNTPPASVTNADRSAQRAALAQERIALDNALERVRKEKADALRTAYSSKQKEEVEGQFSQKEASLETEMADLKSRMRDVDEDSAPAGKPPQRGAAAPAFDPSKFTVTRER